MSKPKSLGQQLDDMQTELNRLKELEKLFDKAVKLEVVSSLIFIFFRRNRTVRYSKKYTQTYTHSNSNNLAV